MRPNEVKNEQAIEMLADMFDPLIKITTDNEVVTAARSGNRLLAVKCILKNHSREVFEIMALAEGVPVDEYECNVMTLPIKLVELFNKPEFEFLFPSQGQKTDETSSGSATENIGVEEK